MSMASRLTMVRSPPWNSSFSGSGSGYDSRNDRTLVIFIQYIIRIREDVGCRISDFGSLEPAASSCDVHGDTRNPTSDILLLLQFEMFRRARGQQRVAA